jgi:predicted adenylyl cyclase CyaB
MPFNIEIKARCDNQDRIRAVLQEHHARFVGEDHQIDTYFNVSNGRLKLREGTIEHTLIHYDRPDQKGPKGSDVLLYEPRPEVGLKAVLSRALGVLVVVDKRREIYFIDNIKFHIDQVEKLGSFVEIEAIDEDGSIGADRLNAQCQNFLELFDLPLESLVAVSYSDLVSENQEDNG